MSLEGEARLVRIFIGESDTWNGRPLSDAIVQKAREMGLAGATVLRGIEGFGARSVVHTARVLRLSQDLPIVIEVVDTEASVQPFLDAISEMVQQGLITTETVQIVKYQAGGGPGQ